MLKSFSKVLTPSSAIFFSLCFFKGIDSGLTATYKNIYIKEDLGASSTLIGKLLLTDLKINSIHTNCLLIGIQGFVGLGSGIFAAAFAVKIFKYIGMINVIFSGLILEGGRSIVLALVQ